MSTVTFADELTGWNEDPEFRPRADEASRRSANSPHDGLSPADLTEWVPRPELIALIRELAHEQDGASLHPVFSFQESRLYPPWMMLGLLAYCYATGLYRSDRIAAYVWQDADLRQLCQGYVPEGQAIQRFRERNWDGIRKLLAQLFLVCAKRMQGVGGQRRSPKNAAKPVPPVVEVDQWTTREAEDRLQRAQRADGGPF